MIKAILAIACILALYGSAAALAQEAGPRWPIGTWAGTIEEKVRASIGACHVVTLSEEPAGIPVWAILLGDDGFIAASSPAICEEENDGGGSSVRPVSLVTHACQRAWFQVPA